MTPDALVNIHVTEMLSPTLMNTPKAYKNLAACRSYRCEASSVPERVFYLAR